MYFTHLLFVDDILIFYDGTKREADILIEGLTLFKRATGMGVNEHKSSILFSLVEADVIQNFLDHLPFQL